MSSLDFHHQRAAGLDVERLWVLAFDEAIPPEVREVYAEEIRQRHDVLYEESEGRRPHPNPTVWAAFPIQETSSGPGCKYRYRFSTGPGAQEPESETE